MKSHTLFIIPVLFLLFASCESENATVIFKASPETVSSRAVQPSTERGISELDSYYSGLGTRLTTLSPESFVLSMQTPAIGGLINDEITEIQFGEPYYELTNLAEIEDMKHVDYVDDYPYEVTAEVSSGIYNTMFMFVTASARDLDINQGTIFEDPRVIVTAPGYTIVEWPDIEGDNESYPKREWLEGNKFAFMLSELLPKVGSLPIEYYMFNTEYTTADILLPGVNAPNFYNTTDYGTLSSGSTGTNFPMLLLPMEAIEITGVTTINFTIETDNIIAIYNNGTPELADDIPVLINEYWKKFILSVE